MIHVAFLEDADTLDFSVCTREGGDVNHCLVRIPKIFKQLESIGLSSDKFDQDLYAIRHRHKIIPKIIATYVKKYLQISDYDPEIMAQMAKYGTADKSDPLRD